VDHPPPSPSDEPGEPAEGVDPRVAQARPGWALVILAAPIVLFAVVIVLYIGMLGLGLQGRGAGQPVRFAVHGCDEAVGHVVERLGDMGLPAEVVDDGGPSVVHTRRVGRPEIDRTVPATLSAPGAFELRHGDDVLATNASVVEATTRLDGMMDPWLLVRLDPEATDAVVQAVNADPSGRLTFVLDGEPVAMQPNRRDVMRGEVEGIPLADMDAATRMASVAAWAVIIDHGPHPCDASVVEVE